MPTPLPHDFDPEKIPDSAWQFDGHSADGYRRYWIAWIDPDKGTYIRKTENLAEPELLAANREAYDASEGQRWSSGMGSDKGGNVPLVHVSSIPLNVFYRDLAPRLREGDRDYTKWWLNREENRHYRVRKGKV